MPDRNGAFERWSALGKLLPRDVRERIFEPAFGDLARSWLTAGRPAGTVPFGLQVLGTFLRCFPIALPRLFFRGGRLTRVGWFSAWAVAVLATVVLVITNLTKTYASY